MAKTIELLLTETVENLGIVGDVVKVRTGYARNFLLPRDYATTPSEGAHQRPAGQAGRGREAARRAARMRADTVQKLEGYELTIQRSCNDLGILYASVTQQEISSALTAAGFGVRPRDVRLSGAIKRVDNYDVHIKYESDLETWIKLHIKADRLLAAEEKPDLDFDNEGNLIQKRERAPREGRGEKPDGDAKAAADAAHADKKGEKKPAKPEAAAAEKKPAAAPAEEAPQKATKKPRQDVKKEAAKKA